LQGRRRGGTPPAFSRTPHPTTVARYHCGADLPASATGTTLGTPTDCRCAEAVLPAEDGQPSQRRRGAAPRGPRGASPRASRSTTPTRYPALATSRDRL